MKQEQIEQIVAATDNLIAQSISDAVAEQFKKRSKPTVNNNLIFIIAAFIAVIAVIASLWFVTNSIKDNQDANAMTLVTAIDEVNQNVQNGDADIIAGVDGLSGKVNDLSGKLDDVVTSNNKVIEETQKTREKVESLSSLISRANKNTLHRYQSCLYNQVTVNKKPLADGVELCKKHLK